MFIILLGLLLSLSPFSQASLIDNINGVHTELNGPNCFNLVAISTGLASSLREVSAEEVEHLTENFCTPVKKNQLAKGDIALIYSVRPRYSSLVHGYIYLKENLAFSKNGLDRTVPYLIQNLGKVEKLYRDPFLGECQPCKNSTKEACKICHQTKFKTRHFRCKNFSKHLVKASKELKQLWDYSSDFAHGIGRINRDFSSYSHSLAGEFLEEYTYLTKEILKSYQQLSPKENSIEKKLWTSLAFRMQGIASIGDYSNLISALDDKYKKLGYAPEQIKREKERFSFESPFSRLKTVWSHNLQELAEGY